MTPSPIKTNQLENAIHFTKLDIAERKKGIDHCVLFRKELVDSINVNMSSSQVARIESMLEDNNIRLDELKTEVRKLENRLNIEEKRLTDYLQSCKE